MDQKNDGEMIPLFKVFMSQDVPSPVSETLMSGYIGQGPQVDKFEKLLSDYLGNKCVSTVNSCTSALHLALHLCKLRSSPPFTVKKIPENSEILTTPLTCAATNMPILANGFRIKWIDIDPKTCNIDMDDLARKISPKTFAIMVVHWGGYPCDLDRLKEIQEICYNNYGHRPRVIEDCAHAWGAKYKGRLLGNHENFCCFSFQAIKHLTTGDGGLLVSPNDLLHRNAELLRWFGLDRTKGGFRCSQNISNWGYKFQMNDIAATIGIHNFPHISGLLQKHRSNAEFYNRELQDTPGVTLLDIETDRTPSYWVYTLLVENRREFIKKMEERGIQTHQVHERNDKYSCMKEFKSPLPGLDRIHKNIVCIPCGWWVTKEDREHIVKTIKNGW